MLQAEVNQLIVMARRSGDNWYIGAMGVQHTAGIDLKVPLKFLGPGTYRAEQFLDDEAAPTRFAMHDATVTSGDTLQLSLSPAGGGAFVKLIPRP